MLSLSSAFRDKLIPWAQGDLEKRLVVARPVMKKSSVPYGVELTRKPIVGKRVFTRHRADGAQRIYRASWPEAGLHELEIPKLVCVLKGYTDYQAGENIVSCSEGHFILLPPRMPNTTGGRSHLEGERRKNGSCELLQLLLLRDSVRCAVCSSWGEQHRDDAAAECVIYHPQAVNLFHLFVEEALHRPDDNDSLCRHLLPSALTFLLREIKAGNHLRPMRPAPENARHGDPMQQIHDYIKTHLRQPLTIEKVAQHMYMSPSQFTRFVRRETGLGFVDILTQYRLEEAKRLLREMDWSIAAVARHVGFQSSTYFITLFGRHMGCSPGEYRNRLKSAPKS